MTKMHKKYSNPQSKSSFTLLVIIDFDKLTIHYEIISCTNPPNNITFQGFLSVYLLNNFFSFILT